MQKCSCQWLMTLILVRSPHRAIAWLQQIWKKSIRVIFTFTLLHLVDIFVSLLLCLFVLINSLWSCIMEQCEHLSNMLVLYASEKKVCLTGLEWNEGANKMVERYFFKQTIALKSTTQLTKIWSMNVLLLFPLSSEHFKLFKTFFIEFFSHNFLTLKPC